MCALHRQRSSACHTFSLNSSSNFKSIVDVLKRDGSSLIVFKLVPGRTAFEFTYFVEITAKQWLYRERSAIVRWHPSSTGVHR